MRKKCMSYPEVYRITNDDLSQFNNQKPTVVALGEVMVRDTPADKERPERTRLVYLSMAGCEFSLVLCLNRLGIPSSFVTRVPDNSYGRALRNIALEQGVNTDHFIWADKTEPMGRFIYEIGRTPRKNKGVYQRMYSAASRLDAGMVDWASALNNARLFHSSGITFGLAYHSNYQRNYCLEAFIEGVASKPENCLVGLDLNYRSTLWSPKTARKSLTPIISEHVDILITTIEDISRLYGIGCGKYTAKQVIDGQVKQVSDDELQKFILKIYELFDINVVAITLRYPDSFEHHRWESASMDYKGNFTRSSSSRSIALMDRLGGGDAWNAGFYYGILTSFSPKKDITYEGLKKGVLVGDAVTRLKQTIMFDLPIIDKEEIEELMIADAYGGGKRTER